jgi:hypothetical protein
MRGLVRVLVLSGVLSACGGKAAGEGDATATGGSTATGGATSTGGSMASGGVTSSMATGGRQSSGDWAASCPDGADSLRFRRLTVSDINATLRDVFGGPATPLGGSWPTQRLGLRGSSDPEQLRRLVEIAQERGLEYAQAHADECADEAQCEPQVRELGLRLFRRPLAEAEVASFLELFRIAAADAGAQAGVAAVVEALIESPYFAFRIDTTVWTSDGLRWSPHSVAARLAYFLWRSGPDAQLLDAASSSEWLESRDVLAQQTRRMLEDPRAEAGFEALVREWLELSQAVPALSVPLEEMEVQTSEFLHTLFTGESPTLGGLLLESRASLNATLADYYGAPSDGLGQGFSEVELDPARFSGILTHGSLLLSHRVPSTRGSLLLRKLLCTQLSAPPAGEMLPEQGSTRRERFEAISASAACRGCHAYLDPLGFALEGFDSLAAPQEVATNGFIQELDGVTNVEFDGPRELAELLAASEQVSHCTVRHFLEYALDGGHGSRQILLQAEPPGPSGEPPKRPPPVECLASAFASESGDLRSLLLGLPLSGVFQNAEVELELTPEVLGATGTTPLEHAAANAALLSRFIASQTLAEMADIRSYADALVMLAEEAP